MNEQLGNLHGTELDSLNMGDSYVALFVGGVPWQWQQDLFQV